MSNITVVTVQPAVDSYFFHQVHLHSKFIYCSEKRYFPLLFLRTLQLCIPTNFRVLRAPESWPKSFFFRFILFFFSTLSRLFCLFWLKRGKKMQKVPTEGVHWHLFSSFQLKKTKKDVKRLNGQKMSDNSQKQYFDQLSSACSTQKQVELHNTLPLTNHLWFSIYLLW